jgi:hypothetical protein
MARVNRLKTKPPRRQNMKASQDLVIEGGSAVLQHLGERRITQTLTRPSAALSRWERARFNLLPRGEGARRADEGACAEDQAGLALTRAAPTFSVADDSIQP